MNKYHFSRILHGLVTKRETLPTQFWEMGIIKNFSAIRSGAFRRFEGFSNFFFFGNYPWFHRTRGSRLISNETVSFTKIYAWFIFKHRLYNSLILVFYSTVFLLAITLLNFYFIGPNPIGSSIRLVLKILEDVIYIQ